MGVWHENGACRSQGQSREPVAEPVAHVTRPNDKSRSHDEKAIAHSLGRSALGGDLGVRVVLAVGGVDEDSPFIGSRLGVACIDGHGGDQCPVLSAAGQCLESAGYEVGLVGKLDDFIPNITRDKVVGPRHAPIRADKGHTARNRSGLTASKA